MGSQERSVARVAVDVPLAHLDRLFDYAITPAQRDDARPGARVRVRFAGKLRDGYIIDVVDTSEVEGKLAPLERVTSPEVVLTPAVARLGRAVADHWGGTFSDVVRLAVPARHATTEKASPPVRPRPHGDGSPLVLPGYPGGGEYLAGLAEGRPLRAVWNPVPVWGNAWVDGILDAVSATVSGGRGAVVIVPESTALADLGGRMEARFGAGTFAELSAELGTAARYRNFLAVARGDVSIVIGTRAAVYAPVHDLGLVVVWDEGNDLLAEPRAPYPHARDVATLRASSEHAGLLLAGFARSAEVQSLVERAWAVALDLPSRDVRRQGPAVRIATDTDLALERDPKARAARLPHDVFAAIRTGLAVGPVLLQVPRAGYAPSMACQRCRTTARCPSCGHPLRGEREGIVCPSCGPVRSWACPHCGDGRLRAPQVGVKRTAEEIGRAFPGVRVVTSWAGHRVEEVGDEPALVLATPGAAPRPAAGYAAAIIMDTPISLGRPELRAAEEAVRRWFALAALVVPGDQGGTITAVGDQQSRALQALVRLDAAGFATRELAERTETHFPPAARVVTVDGPREAVEELVHAASGVTDVEQFGPVPLDPDGVRWTLRVPASRGSSLIDALRGGQAVRTARKSPGAVRLRVDPMDL